ncbi:protein translocase subunit SecD [Blastochloris tepida]|uniref:Protein translocase subunit SecD n=1 Tax=Blastochloris tepida TaxID=2233851 RepID=A0A348FZH9_9HYPH|nr:protein translocase subunit SecD [Blastochloris tepida]BBF92712.1 protein translocase subunit SecD [Blastochloris tepida]
MLVFTRLKALAILAVALVGCLLALPNALPASVLHALPSWAQRTMVLGLDLQGGSYILLEVDVPAVRKERLEALRDDVRRVLREARVGYTGLGIQGDSVQVRIREGENYAEAVRKLGELSEPIGGMFGGSSQRTIDLREGADGLIQLVMTQAGLNERVKHAVDQSIEIVRRRIDQLGTTEPAIQRQGASRILVQVPGLQDPTRLKQLIGTTAKLSFRLVDMSMSPEIAESGRAPPDSEVLQSAERGAGPVLVERRVMVAGEDLVDAQPGFDSRTREPVVNFRFNTNGARRFAAVTQENVGRPFAIVLDNQVISAPVIREPILGGSGQISGRFTVQQANDLAILLRAGALPAPLTVVEERTIGPSLGQDSVRAGTYASIIGSIFVIVFMLVIYGLFGLFANLAMIVNILMLLGILSALEATLTLPGIAGILLTVGMAVDSNVLIYERVRDEVRNGRSAITALDHGFREALATIIDANMTTLIAGFVLFLVGTGAVRGFAVTLSLGIVTTVFTAFVFTRLIIASWVRWARPARLPI